MNILSRLLLGSFVLGVSLSSVVGLLAPQPAHADMISDLRAQLHALSLQVAALQSKLQEQIAPPPSSEFTIGTRGEAVRQLQKTLKDSGFFTLEPTGYFGEITKNAMLRWRASQKATEDSRVTEGGALQGREDAPDREDIHGLSCEPSMQTIESGSFARVTVDGSVQSYAWSAPEGVETRSEGNAMQVKYVNTGRDYLLRTVTVRGGGLTASCGVRVAPVGGISDSTSLAPLAPTSSPPIAPPPPAFSSRGDRYSISSSGSGPKVTSLVVDPLDAGSHETQAVRATINYSQGIRSVSFILKTDSRTKTVFPTQTEGNEREGAWSASWTIEDTTRSEYILTIRVEGKDGSLGSVDVFLPLH